MATTSQNLQEPCQVPINELNKVQEALTMINSKSPLVSIDGIQKLSSSIFNKGDLKVVAAKMGAMKRIVDAMRRYSDNGSVQEDGCHALRNLVFKNAYAQENLIEQEALDVVIKAMESHPLHNAVHAEALWALVVFCSNNDQVIEKAKEYQHLVEQSIKTHQEKDTRSRGQFLLALFSS